MDLAAHSGFERERPSPAESLQRQSHARRSCSASESLDSLIRMASFAERVGKRAERSITQTDDLDADTRTELWNVIVTLRTLLNQVGRQTGWDNKTEDRLVGAVWAWEFKRARDEMKSDALVWDLIKKRILEGEWYDALDLIEEIVKYLKRYEEGQTRGLDETMTEAFNNRFEHFLVGYRFIGHEITPIDTSADAEAVSVAIDDAATIAGARHSLTRATELLADRENHDYPNSIKESISAVEAVVMKVTGEGTLGAGLKKLENAGLKIHPALRDSWSKMYGWTSDEDGIRHAGIDAADVDQALAKYALITCSAFVSYLIEEGRKVGLLT